MGLPMKDPAKRINRVKPALGEWVDLAPLEKPVLVPYPTAWFRKGTREYAVPKWIWDLWRQDPVTSQWSPGDQALALELGQTYYAFKPELRLKMQTLLGLNARGRRDLRWRNAAETDSAAKADEHAREARRLRIVKPEQESE
jgi:hypothetical protein